MTLAQFSEWKWSVGEKEATKCLLFFHTVCSLHLDASARWAAERESEACRSLSERRSCGKMQSEAIKSVDLWSGAAFEGVSGAQVEQVDVFTLKNKTNIQITELKTKQLKKKKKRSSKQLNICGGFISSFKTFTWKETTYCRCYIR